MRETQNNLIVFFSFCPHRGEGDPEQSYSERQLYEMALGRFARELVAVNDIAIEDAIKKTEENLKASS